jgi:hypothetical protein
MKTILFNLLCLFFVSCSSETNNTDHTMISKTDKMMEEDLFWQIVSNSLQHTDSQQAQEGYLVKALEKLSPAEIIGFRLRTDKLLYDTYNSEIWCAAYIINGGCSDDGFEYFRCWLISRGKETFEKTKINPDFLANVIEEGEEYEFESFWYVALEAFKNKTGKDLYDYIDENFKTNEGNYPAIEFTWQEENPESMKKICPRLFEKVNG